MLIDDGAATGQTLLCAIRELRKLHPERIVLAVPVASSDAESLLKSEVDDFICPMIRSHLYAIGAFYRDFRQVTDEEVLELIKMNSAFTE